MEVVFGYGFIIRPKEIKELEKYPEIYNNFYYNKHTIIIDEENPLTTSFFFGLRQGFLKCGYGVELDDRRHCCTKDDLNTMISQFKFYFPNRNNYTPKDCILALNN